MTVLSFVEFWKSPQMLSLQISIVANSSHACGAWVFFDSETLVLMILSGILFTIALAISSMATTFVAGQRCKMQMTENAPEAFEGDDGRQQKNLQ